MLNNCLITAVYIQCSICGRTSRTPEVLKNVFAQNLLKEGWTGSNQDDVLCPNCNRRHERYLDIMVFDE